MVKDPKLQEECRAKAAVAAQGNPAISPPRRDSWLEDDLNPIRDDPRFKKILELAKKRANANNMVQ